MNGIFLVLLILILLSACGGKTKNELYSEGLKQLEASNPVGAAILFKNALDDDENFLNARFQLAKSYAEIGKFEQAEKEFNKVLKQNPTRDEVLLELAGITIVSKRFDEAFALGLHYLDRHPGSIDGLEIMGIVCEAKAHYEDAERYLLQAIAIDPFRTKIKLELASVYVLSGRVTDAKKLLNDLTGTDPKNPQPFYMLADIETLEGNSDKALRLYSIILANNASETFAAYKTGIINIERHELNKADKIADDLLRNFPKSAEGYRLKGLVCYQRKDYTGAIGNLQLSTIIFPTIEAHHFLGLCFFHLGESENALIQYRKILEKVPDSRQAALMLATVLLAQKRVDEAISAIQQMPRKDDRDAVAHELLGSAYLSKGLFEDGIREFETATEIDPGFVDTFLKTGYFSFKRGRNTGGDAELSSAVYAVPDVLNRKILLAVYYLRSGRSDKALLILKSGITGKKSDVILYNCIAVVYFLQHNPYNGLKSIQKAKDADHAYSASYLNLAAYFTAEGKYEKAINEYTVLLRKDSQNLPALLGLAKLYETKGSDCIAEEYFKKTLETKQPAAFMAMAGYYLKKHETYKALKALDEVLKIDSRKVDALEMRGRLLLSEKRYQEAVMDFERLEAVESELGESLIIDAYISMNEIAKAEETARNFIKTHPNSARGYMQLDAVYKRKNELSHSMTKVSKGIREVRVNMQASDYMHYNYEAPGIYDQVMYVHNNSVKNKYVMPMLLAQGVFPDYAGKKKEPMSLYSCLLEKSYYCIPAINNPACILAFGFDSKEEMLSR